MGDVIIYGTHGFASEVQQFIEDVADSGPDLKCIGFLIDHKYRKDSVVRNLPVFDRSNVPKHECVYVIGVGATEARLRIARHIQTHFNASFVLIKHPRAWVGRRVDLGIGTIVCPGALVTADVIVGDHVQLHVGCTVAHNTVIGSFVTIAPGAHVSGRVKIGEGAFIGAGAVILPDVQVGSWTMVGAGAVVTKNVPDNGIVAGVPARIRRQRAQNWHLLNA